MSETNLNENVAEEQQTPPELSPIEVEAQQHGWKPKDEFTDETKRWIPAEEFMERQSFFNKINSLTKEVRTLRGELNIVADHHAKVKEEAYKRAITELKAAKAKALEDDNVTAVVEIDDMLADVKQRQSNEAQTPSPVVQQMKEIYTNWTDSNAWYNQDEELHDFADAQGLVIRNKNPNLSYEDVLNKVAEKVKKQFPEKFGGQKAVPPQPSNRTTPEATSNVVNRNAGKLREADLPEDARKVMNVLIKRIPGYTKEKYLEEYSKT